MPAFLGYHGYPEDALHVGELAGRARHPVQEGEARGGRHPLGRRRGSLRRLLRRQRADLRRRRDQRRGAAPARGDRALARGGHRGVPSGQPAVRHRARGADGRRGRRASAWCASTSVTGSAARCTRTRTCRTTARAGTGPKLEVGMVFAIEPMVNAGGAAVESLADGWTVVTRTGRCPRTSSTRSRSPPTVR